MAVRKPTPNGPMPATKRPLVPAPRTLTKGMSASVYVDRPTRKVSATKNPPAAPRKRSASPKSSSAVQPLKPASMGASSDSLALLKPNEVPLPNSDAVALEPTSVTQEKGPDVDVIDVGISPASESVVPISDAPGSPEHSDTVIAVESEATPDLSKHVFEPNTDDISTLPHSVPLKAETKGAGEGALLNESEAAIYRAKLFEQRRLAKERKEQEQRRLEEEQRRRKSQQEAERLATEQAALEQAERLAQEEAEARRLRDEEEKARLRAAEAERLAKLQRAEEERIMRKKRLDSIMSRVKLPTANGKTSDPPPTSISASPLLQGCENGEPNTVAVTKDDASNPVLLHHSVTCPQDFEQSVDTPPLESHGSVGRTEDQCIPSTEKEQQNDSPVIFSLPVERNGLPNGHGEFNSVDPKPDFADCNGMGAGIASGGNSSLHAFHQPSPNRPTSVPNSPVKSALSLSVNSDVPSTVDGNATAPLFKSALLQSMLGGGRLATRAKDAVIGLRRGSSTQLHDCGSRPTDDESGANSPQLWKQLTPSGDHAMEDSGSPSIAGPMTCSRQADLNRSSPMVQSMFEGTVDNFRLNCSNEAPRSVGSPTLPLAQHQD
ncbi:unnamed protein product [Dicrocoelium dendriticum]|nr:unnamed protein product [Dicrocoelium dendriticum]